MRWYMPPDQQHAGQAIGIIGLAVIIGVATVLGAISWASNRDRDQRQQIARQAHEIARLSKVCPPAEAGEKLVSAIRFLGGDEPGALRCIYTSNSGYSDVARARPAMPGRAS